MIGRLVHEWQRLGGSLGSTATGLYRSCFAIARFKEISCLMEVLLSHLNGPCGYQKECRKECRAALYWTLGLLEDFAKHFDVLFHLLTSGTTRSSHLCCPSDDTAREH